MLVEWDAAPAGGARNPVSGRPRATVRSNYVGLPSMAGRGRTNAGGSPRDQGGEEPAVRPRKRGPEDTNRRDGALRGERARAKARSAARRRLMVAPLGAPSPRPVRPGGISQQLGRNAPRERRSLRRWTTRQTATSPKRA